MSERLSTFLQFSAVHTRGGRSFNKRVMHNLSRLICHSILTTTRKNIYRRRYIVRENFRAYRFVLNVAKSERANVNVPLIRGNNGNNVVSRVIGRGISSGNSRCIVRTYVRKIGFCFSWLRACSYIGRGKFRREKRERISWKAKGDVEGARG